MSTEKLRKKSCQRQRRQFIHCYVHVDVQDMQSVAGGHKLPQNLRSMFRTIAVVMPDPFPIVDVKLASYGFVASSVLARKICTLYALCNQLLTQQVKSVACSRDVKSRIYNV